MAVYDIAPSVKGHTLLIPKRHVANFSELNDNEILDMLSAMKILLPVLVKLYGDESNSYNILSQVGPSSGMSIPHLHIHILPRKKNDKYNTQRSNIYFDVDSGAKSLSNTEYKLEVEKLRKEF